jgi:hypothetical protein
MGAYVPAGIGFHCEECKVYFHPGDPGSKEISAWWTELNRQIDAEKAEKA